MADLMKKKALAEYRKARDMLGPDGDEILQRALSLYAKRCEENPSLYMPPDEWLRGEHWKAELL